jgi:DNA-binding NarL/FixJ family response regulator
MPDIHVLIADDHPIVCKGIRNILDPAPGIKVSGEAHSGAETLQMIADLKPDVLLLDMELPDMNGVEVIRQIADSGTSLRVLGLSSYDDSQYISELLASGAAGYLIKDEVPESIVEAVRGVARGETGWLSRKAATRLGELLQREKEGNLDLTSRELDVLRLVSQGKTNGEIGYELSISEKTVEKHLATIYRKLGVVSRVEAAVIAVRENLV